MTSSREPLTDLTGLVTTWTSVLDSIPLRGRSLWLMFLHDDGTPHPALTQIEGLSLAPDGVAITNLGDIVRRLLEDDPGLGGVTVCLERGGTSGASPFEEGWADALTRTLERHLTWPVLVRTPDGISPVKLWTSAA